MNSAKLNRHFIIELRDEIYVWTPCSTVYYVISESERQQVVRVEQDIINGTILVVTILEEIPECDVECLCSKLRYPFKKRLKPGYAQ